MTRKLLKPGSRPASIQGPSRAGIYKIGGAAALSLVAIMLLQVVAFILWPPPYEGSAADWFEVFRNNSLVGLISFELLMVVYVILSIPMNLALYFALRKAEPAWMAVYLAFSLIGCMAFISARPGFEMLALSARYTAAGEAERIALLASGETLLAAFEGMAFQVSYFLGALNGLIISLVILRRGVFSKPTGWLRLASGVFDFGLFVPGIGLILSLVSVLCLLAWNLLVGLKLLKMEPDPA